VSAVSVEQIRAYARKRAEHNGASEAEKTIAQDVAESLIHSGLQLERVISQAAGEYRRAA
jgi:phosphosulfolactate synthase (CoM biosynthesis protein A)